MTSSSYESLNKAWLSTCRVLFRSDAPSLSQCSEWLSEYTEKMRLEKSSLSKKPVVLSQNAYAKNASFRAFDEVDFGAKFQPLSINEVKDIDSIIGALGERAYYTGNVILGNSSGVENSSGVVDSHFVSDSTMVFDSKHVAHSVYVRRSEYVFGMLGSDKNIHTIKSTGAEMTRCFECHMVEVLSDCYYCAKVQNCHDAMFCFGAENGSYLIGNTKLPKDKYLALKAKLLREMGERLLHDKRLPSILEIIEQSCDYPTDPRLKFAKEKEKQTDLSPVERAFSQTSQLLLGRQLSGIDSYSKFLQKHVPANTISKSALTSGKVINGGYRVNLFKLYDFEKRTASDEELREIGKLGIGADAAEKLSLDAGSAAKLLHPIAYMNLDKIAGRCTNLRDCAVSIDAQDCYSGSAFTWCKKSAFCFWASVSEQIFGSACVFDSSFCMKCYYSKKMTRAFECDGCEACADIYFSHNCENVRDSMFCFNAKNLTNAIGNAALPPEQYKRAKSALLLQIADELEKKKDLKWDIFSIAAKK